MSKVSIEELKSAIADELVNTQKNTPPGERLNPYDYCWTVTERLRVLFDVADKREEPEGERYVDLSFGEVVTSVIDELLCADSSLDPYERDHPASAVEHYRREVHSRLQDIWFPAFKQARMKKTLIKMIESGELAALIKG